MVTTVYHWHAHAVADLQFTTDGNIHISLSVHECILVFGLPYGGILIILGFLTYIFTYAHSPESTYVHDYC